MKNKSVLCRRLSIICACVLMSVLFTGCGPFGKKDEAEVSTEEATEGTTTEYATDATDETDQYATDSMTDDMSAGLQDDSFATPVEDEPEEEVPPTEVPEASAIGPDAKKAKNLEALTGTYSEFVTGLADTDYYALVTAADGKDVLLVAQDVISQGTDDYCAYECDVYFFNGTEVTQLGRIVSDKDNGCIIEMSEDGYILVAGGTPEEYPYQFMKIKIDTTGQQLTAYECDTQTGEISYTYLSESTGGIEQPAEDDGMQFKVIKAVYDDSVNHAVYFTPKAPAY